MKSIGICLILYLIGEAKVEVGNMSFKEWISYLIKRWIHYVETPIEERKEQKQARKENWSSRWFGMIPFSMKMMFMRMKDRFPYRK